MVSLPALVLQLQVGLAAAAVTTTHHTLNSGHILAEFSPSGITGMGLLPPPPTQAELAGEIASACTHNPARTPCASVFSDVPAKLASYALPTRRWIGQHTVNAPFLSPWTST